jgi:hypothetical protein
VRRRTRRSDLKCKTEETKAGVLGSYYIPMHDQKSFVVDESVSLSVYVFLSSVFTSRLPNYLDTCLFELIIAVVTHLTRLPGKLVRWVATDYAMHLQSPEDYHHYHRDRHVVVRCAPFFFKQMSGSFRFGSAAVVTKLATSLIQSVRTQRASSVNEPPHQDRTTKKMRLLSHPQKLLS